MVLFGSLIGWIGHRLIHKEFVSIDVSNNPLVEKSSNDVVKEDIGENGIQSKLSSFSSTPVKGTEDFDYKKAVSRVFLSDNYQQAVRFCLSLENGKKDGCKICCFKPRLSAETSISDAQRLLDIWLAEHPEDIEATLIRIHEDVTNGEFLEVVNRLAFLNSYQVDAGDVDRVARGGQKIARGAIINLTIKSDMTPLRLLLATLIDIKSTRSA